MYICINLSMIIVDISLYACAYVYTCALLHGCTYGILVSLASQLALPCARSPRFSTSGSSAGCTSSFWAEMLMVGRERDFAGRKPRRRGNAW